MEPAPTSGSSSPGLFVTPEPELRPPEVSTIKLPASGSPAPDESAGEVHMSGESESGESESEKAVSDKSESGESTPEESTSRESTPEESTSGESTLQEPAPEQPAPEQPAPENPGSGKLAPEHPRPEKSAIENPEPGDSAPKNPAPEEHAPQVPKSVYPPPVTVEDEMDADLVATQADINNTSSRDDEMGALDAQKRYAASVRKSPVQSDQRMETEGFMATEACLTVPAAEIRVRELEQEIKRKRDAHALTNDDEIRLLERLNCARGDLQKARADAEYDQEVSDEMMEHDDSSPGHSHTSAAALPCVPPAPNDPVVTKGFTKKGKPRKRRAPSTKKAQKQPNKKVKISSALGSGMENICSNVFEDVQKTRGLASEPTFSGTKHRKEALKQLAASCRVESSRTATCDKQALENAIKNFTGRMSLSPTNDGKWDLKGLKTSLKSYQVLGAGWMRKRENESHTPDSGRGGILADEMGLGKTVMMLANIVNGKPKAKDIKVATTLIIASPALVGQWASEIAKHVKSSAEDRIHGITGSLRFHSGSRCQGDPKSQFEMNDIVLTTWYEVTRSYPKGTPPVELTTTAEREAWWDELWEKERGVFHRINWYRVVLDEAQSIRNHETRTSRACRALQAQFKWAISATPMYNRPSEMYSYLHFLEEPSIGSYALFTRNYCSPGGQERLNVLLRKYMIRRTHADVFMQARLLDLPECTSVTLWIDFNPIERQIYDLVRNRFIDRVNTIARQGGEEVKKQFRHIWTMLQVLRQLCSHLLMIQEAIEGILTQEDWHALRAICQSTAAEMTEDCSRSIAQVRAVLQYGPVSDESSGPERVLHASTPMGYIDDQHTGGPHGHEYDIVKYLDVVEGENESAINQRTKCSGCCHPPVQAYMTSCGHIYCGPCLIEMLRAAALDGRDHSRCKRCGNRFDSTQPCFSTGATVGTGQKIDWLKDIQGGILPSSKTLAIKAQILNWLEKDPNTKIIIYTQWMAMIHILGKVFETEGWSFVQYCGSMSQDQRQNALDKFGNEDERVQILLGSLKCGGLGLNLTMASKVLLVEPWWNSAVEKQSFGRVYRFGQDKETEMMRIGVSDSVDSAMFDLKERKQIDIDQIMDGRSNKKNISTDDLLRLFGADQKTNDDGNTKTKRKTKDVDSPFILLSGYADGVVEPKGRYMGD